MMKWEHVKVVVQSVLLPPAPVKEPVFGENVTAFHYPTPTRTHTAGVPVPPPSPLLHPVG